jgi:hypothetical protein
MAKKKTEGGDRLWKTIAVGTITNLLSAAIGFAAGLAWQSYFPSAAVEAELRDGVLARSPSFEPFYVVGWQDLERKTVVLKVTNTGRPCKDIYANSFHGTVWTENRIGGSWLSNTEEEFVVRLGDAPGTQVKVEFTYTDERQAKQFQTFVVALGDAPGEPGVREAWPVSRSFNLPSPNVSDGTAND